MIGLISLSMIYYKFLGQSCLSGWWFGLFFMTFHILGIIIPTD